jgi:hypothetical protein
MITKGRQDNLLAVKKNSELRAGKGISAMNGEHRVEQLKL